VVRTGKSYTVGKFSSEQHIIINYGCLVFRAQPSLTESFCLSTKISHFPNTWPHNQPLLSVSTSKWRVQCAWCPLVSSFSSQVASSPLFLKLDNISLCVCVCVWERDRETERVRERDRIFLIHSLVDRHLGCFLFLASVNMGWRLSPPYVSFSSFGHIPSCGIAGSHGNSIF
jgi:hypothetical protein